MGLRDLAKRLFGGQSREAPGQQAQQPTGPPPEAPATPSAPPPPPQAPSDPRPGSGTQDPPSQG
jgi:hypothetical protein